MKTCDSCRPELAVEPSYSKEVLADSDEGSESSSVEKKRLLIKKCSREKKKHDVVNETLGLIKSVLEKDPTKELLSYLKDESEKAREHALKLMQLLTQSSSTFHLQQT